MTIVPNLWANRYFANDGPLIGKATDSVPPRGGKARLLDGRDHRSAAATAIPVTAGDQFRFEATVRRLRGTHVLNGGLWRETPTSAAGTYPAWSQMTEPDENGWARYGVTVTVPTTMTSASLFFQIPQNTPYTTAWEISDLVWWNLTTANGATPYVMSGSDVITLAVLTSPTYVRRYYQLRSSTLSPPPLPTTNPPPEPWSTVEPGYTEGSTQTLYTVMLTAYGSAAFEYGPVQKDSAYEAVKAAYNLAIAAGGTAASAKTTADGKNRIIPSVGEPSRTDPLLKPGDQWWILAASGPANIIGVKIWNGTDWSNFLFVANSIIVPGSVGDTIIADEGITTPKIAAEAVEGSHVKAGTLETTHVSATFGSDLILESNNSVTTIITQQSSQSAQLASLEESTDTLATVAQTAASQASQTAAQVNGLAGELEGISNTATDARDRVTNLQTWFRVDIEGAHVGAVGSAFQTHIKPDRFEITENNAVTTYWESGRMVVPSMETDEIVITNFKFEAYEAGMVVRLG